MRVTQIHVSDRPKKNITREELIKAGKLAECFKRYTSLTDEEMETIIEAQLKRKIVENADYRWYIYKVFCNVAEKAGMEDRWKEMVAPFSWLHDEEDFKAMVLVFAMLMNEKVGQMQNEFDNGYVTAMYTKGVYNK